MLYALTDEGSDRWTPPGRDYAPFTPRPRRDLAQAAREFVLALVKDRLDQEIASAYD